MKQFIIVFKDRSRDVANRPDYTMRVEGEILAFNKGVARTRNAGLAQYIKSDMSSQFEVMLEGSDPVLDEAVVDDEPTPPKPTAKAKPKVKVPSPKSAAIAVGEVVAEDDGAKTRLPVKRKTPAKAPPRRKVAVKAPKRGGKKK